MMIDFYIFTLNFFRTQLVRLTIGYSERSMTTITNFTEMTGNMPSLGALRLIQR